ncbi:hypothetical protein AALO_G00303610 [Alosa alosa]|uniref:Tudor domain-containing protein n=1 Tax=Alosa alosa TaxID=278164 RepID=A0AAV6FI53_9TELE|nr:hypothetical protein AALO_G00303610 [Alosa alosa]
MREFYGQDNTRKALTNPVSGQLAAVRAEEEEEILRAQVCEVMADKVKVYYVDHGFSEVISKTKLLELHEKFFKLPFQATKCKLAGLEQFSQEASVLKKFDSMASGKILLAEILERQETPLMVLYDTSQDDDVNINAACMKALQDKSLESPLQVNSAYMNVSVSSVCSDGTIYCQLPSRGLAKLTEVLGKTEAYFHSQVTSEFLVSRPFCGKGCLARYKGKWSRVEITNLHGSRVLDILFIDLGVQASVEVIELREFPPPHLRDLIAIPPQVVKCCLADLAVSVGSWTPDAVQWLRDTVLHCSDCSIKIAKQEESKRLVHVHLFTSKNFHDMSRSVNRQLADSDLWKHQKDVFLSSHAPSLKTTPTTVPGHTHHSGSPTSTNGTRAPQLRRAHSLPGTRGTPPTTPQHTATPAPQARLQMPPLLELPPAGQNLDVYVSVACHPGHFVLQSWQDMYKLVVLMGEMILHYNKTNDKPVAVETNQVYARQSGEEPGVRRQSGEQLASCAGEGDPDQWLGVRLRTGLRQTRAGQLHPAASAHPGVPAAALPGNHCPASRCEASAVVGGGVHRVPEPRGEEAPGGPAGGRAGGAQRLGPQGDRLPSGHVAGGARCLGA